MSAPTCTYTEDQILAYVAGELAETEELAIAEHLPVCVDCREQAVEFTGLRSTLAVCVEHAVRWHEFDTPFGRMYVAATDRGLVRVSWHQSGPDAFEAELERRFPGRPVLHDAARLVEVERELNEYFAGARSRFELPVDLTALSEFERRVLEAARAIPFGVVIPYAELARRIQNPKAARAVGNALGRNPVPIVVPCHRIVRNDGSLGGYSGGGPEYKQRLLALERAS